MKNLIKLIKTLQSQGHMSISATFPHMLPLANKVPLTLLQSIYGYENDRYIINRGDRLIALITYAFYKNDLHKIINNYLVNNPYFESFAFTRGTVLLSSFKHNKSEDTFDNMHLECFPVYIDEINGFDGTGGIRCRKIKPVSINDYNWLVKNNHTSPDFERESNYEEIYPILMKYINIKKESYCELCEIEPITCNINGIDLCTRCKTLCGYTSYMK